MALAIPEIRSLEQWRREFLRLSEHIARNAAERIDAEVTAPREGVMTIHIARPIVNDYHYRPSNNAITMALAVSRAINRRGTTFEQIRLPYIRDAQYDFQVADVRGNEIERAVYNVRHSPGWMSRAPDEIATGAFSNGFAETWRELLRRFSEPALLQYAGTPIDANLVNLFSDDENYRDRARAWFKRAYREIGEEP